MKTIDLDSWPRKSHFHLFRNHGVPHFTVTAEVDITDMLDCIKAQGTSVFSATMFCLMRAVNAVPELRMRFHGDSVVEHAVTHPGVTVPIEGERFNFCYIEYSENWKIFEASATAAIEQASSQPDLVNKDGEHDNLTYMTCLPWMTASSIQFPVLGPDDCVPRVGWSRFATREGRTMQPVHVMAHHALVDGLHVGRFFQNLEALLKDIPDTFSL
ncbi:CatA-like O-acetyltransferase [Salidesulfovibrio onnuriiensis]|uniref:CatA-like O-acetyltransferase n=1 Tax=Salidesulfovibrio onnuriiensis TaxID=2583823 RepID=UPI00165060D5|nr:CatA-like O-acetyltransferase [Salidesulfovibrio onnuriiensis]